MAKPKTAAIVPVILRRLKRRDEIVKALSAEGITATRIAGSIGSLLDAKKRVMVYSDDGRSTEFIIDATAVRSGVELALQLWGVIKAQGFDVPESEQDTETASALLTGRAVGKLYVEKHEAGESDEQIDSWIATKEGILTVRARVAAAQEQEGKIGA